MSHNRPAEIDSLTTLRGLAAMWVVVHHLQTILYALLPEAKGLDPLIAQGHVAVPLFFILSGYVISLRYLEQFRNFNTIETAKFLWLRLGRIYPVHLVTLLVCVAMVARHGWPDDAGHSPGRFISNLFMTQAWDPNFRLSWNYPAWSISSEWFAYLSVPVLALILTRLGKRSLLCVTLLCCGTSTLAVAYRHRLPFEGLALVVPTFIGGAALARIGPPLTASFVMRRISELLLALVICVPFVVSNPTMIWIILFFAGVAILGRSGHESSAFWRFRPFVYLGDISYSLYMTHAITITLISVLLPISRFAEAGLMLRLAIMVTVLVTIFIGAIALHYTIELPMRNLSRRVVRKPRLSAP